MKKDFYQSFQTHTHLHPPHTNTHNSHTLTQPTHHLHRAVVTDVVIEGPRVGVGAVGQTAADLVRGVPDHLGVVAYHVEVVVVAPVGEVVLF